MNALISDTPPPPRPRRSRVVGLAVLIGLVATAVFGFRLSSEPHFVDESAYYSQSGYADLLINDRNNPAWLDYAGYDLPPLPKYLIGWSLQAFGYPRPAPRSAWLWYANTSKRFETPDSLLVARYPSVLVGALGCVAIALLGSLAFDARVGLLSALLLMANPLYRLHSRRAMSDTPAEAFLLIALALGAWAWVRFMEKRACIRTILITLCAGLAVGISVLSKLNGTISGLILIAWAAAGLLYLSRASKESCSRSVAPTQLTLVGSLLLAGLASFLLFVVLNPFLTAQPPPPLDPRLADVAALSFPGRVKMVAEHRIEASRAGQKIFPNDALTTPWDKLTAVVVQGFGRFGPFGPARSDSTKRLDFQQDWGALLWCPLVCLGLAFALIEGRRRALAGLPPTPRLIAIQGVMAFFAVTAYIPLAWDRYYISLQPGSCLLAAVALVTLWDRVRRGSAT